MAETPRGPDVPSSENTKPSSLIKKAGQAAAGVLFAAQLAGAEAPETTSAGPDAKQDVPGLAVPDAQKAAQEQI